MECVVRGLDTMLFAQRLLTFDAEQKRTRYQICRTTQARVLLSVQLCDDDDFDGCSLFVISKLQAAARTFLSIKLE